MNVVSKLARGFAYAVAALCAGFALNAQADDPVLPSRYAQVDYVDFPRSPHARIATGVYWNDGLKAELSFRCTEIGGGKYDGVFGDIQTTSRMFGYVDSTSTWKMIGQGLSAGKQSLNTDYVVVSSVNGTSGTFQLNGGTAKNIAIAKQTKQGECYLGSLYAYRAYRVYYAKVYENLTTLVRHYIPAYDRVTGQYGMWDAVNESFMGHVNVKGPAVAPILLNTVTFDDGKVACTITTNGVEVAGLPCELAYGAEVVVTARPLEGYAYLESHAGWTPASAGAIAHSFVADGTVTSYDITVPDPNASTGELVTLTIVNSANATAQAFVGDDPVGTTIQKGSAVRVVATANVGYAYRTGAEGWTLQDNGTLLHEIPEMNADAELTVPDPVADLCTVTISEPSHATYTAKIGDVDVTSGQAYGRGLTVTVVSTPEDDFEYVSATAPWEKNLNGTIEAAFVIEADPTVITIPSPTRKWMTLAFHCPPSAEMKILVDGKEYTESTIECGTEYTVVLTPKTSANGTYAYDPILPGWTDVGDGKISKAYTASGVENDEVLSAPYWTPNRGGNYVDNGDFQQTTLTASKTSILTGNTAGVPNWWRVASSSSDTALQNKALRTKVWVTRSTPLKGRGVIDPAAGVL